MEMMATQKTMSELEQKYNDVVALYDLAEELAATVDTKLTKDNAAQMDLVDPLIEAIAYSTDILSEEFITLCEGNKAKKAAAKSKIETAMRKIYVAMHEYGVRATKVTQNAVGGFRNLADPIVEKIKRQMEKVVANFLEFIQLSLDRIMQKHDIDELKQRHERVALMLHTMSVQQGSH
jgi:glutamate-1-semialdehyde aminotransferase